MRATNVDKVIDFTPGADKPVLEHGIFMQLRNAGALDATNFVANATGTAVDANDYVVYNTASGELSHDADSNGNDAAVAFATLASHPALTAADFMIV